MNWSGNLAWRIEITETAKKQLAKLDHQVQVKILRYLREKSLLKKTRADMELLCGEN